MLILPYKADVELIPSSWKCMRQKLIACALFSLMYCTGSAQEREPSTLAVYGGQLIGENHGEWGGSLVYQNRNGQTQALLDKQVIALHDFGPAVLVFTGLDHLRSNIGQLYIIRETHDGTLTISLLHQLKGTPRDVTQLDTGEMAFHINVISTEPDQQKLHPISRKRVRICQLLDALLQVTERPCPTP
jgi:hypothetical protein